MRTKFLLLLLFASFTAKSQNITVSGLQSGVWHADTVFVEGDVFVQDSLHIMAGTTVLFNSFFGITLEQGAVLKAIGTATDSIVFTVADTTGFHIFNNGRGGWNGIRLNKAGSTKFDYCKFQFGKAALDHDQDGGALRVFNSDEVEISHSTLYSNFSREHGGALSAVKSNVAIRDCDVCNNQTYTGLDTVYAMYGGGMRFLNCKVEITGSNFLYNNGQNAVGGALSLDSCAVLIDRCRFEHNYGINGAGLYLIRSNDWECRISNSLFANNTSGHFGGGLAISDSSPLVSNLTVVNNHSIGVNCGGIFFYQYSSPELWNCIVYGNTNEVPLEEPIQMWAWTYDQHAPKFHNCLVQFGLENISGNYDITVYENCLDADPMFSDECFRVWENSPCFNAGSPETPDVILNGLDLSGSLRVLHGCIDIGAYETDLTGIAENTENEQPVRIVGNPITASSYAEIELKEAGKMVAKVYSTEGKLLKNVEFGLLPSGLHYVALGNLMESLSGGIYLLVIQNGQNTWVSKMIKPL